MMGILPLPISANTKSSVRCARLSTDVNATSNLIPRALSFSPAFFASATPCSVRSTSFQPVNKFFRFHSLWPWRRSTRRRSVMLCPSNFAKAQYVGHRIETGLPTLAPLCRSQRATREDHAVLGPVYEFDSFGRASEDHAVVTYNAA